jgi:hypothetical protein
MPTPRLDELERILARIRELFEQEYLRGEQDAIERMIAAAQRGAVGNIDVSSLRRKVRVPRGAPEAFARRVLQEAFPEGRKVDQILDKAETPEERSITRDALRISLYRGEKEGWVKNLRGTWTLIKLIG